MHTMMMMMIGPARHRTTSSSSSAVNIVLPVLSPCLRYVSVFVSVLSRACDYYKDRGPNSLIAAFFCTLRPASRHLHAPAILRDQRCTI